MSTTAREISDSLTNVCWAANDDVQWLIDSNTMQSWPMHDKLTELLTRVPMATKLKELLTWVPQEKKKEVEELLARAAKGDERDVGKHVKAVVASVNPLLGGLFNDMAFRKQDNSPLSVDTRKRINGALGATWTGGGAGAPAILGDDDENARRLLRVAALYHDMGKWIHDDHHVSRGVHLMRDVSDKDRHEVEALFHDSRLSDVSDTDRREVEDLFHESRYRRYFWVILRHHDVFGNLGTGEASLPALTDIASWVDSEDSMNAGCSTLEKLITYLFWLNLADANASLRVDRGMNMGDDAIETYIDDWESIRGGLHTLAGERGATVSRSEFKEWTLKDASRPEKTIERITRLVCSCYVGAMEERVDDSFVNFVRSTVEQELQGLQGPRMESFCYRFARFCKLEYARRFFLLLMRVILRSARLMSQDEDGEWVKVNGVQAKAGGQGSTWSGNRRDCEKALAEMISRTCLILGRIVREYGHLVEGDARSCPRLSVNMSDLMVPGETGLAICESLKHPTESRALWWIVDEVSVRLYGE